MAIIAMILLALAGLWSCIAAPPGSSCWLWESCVCFVHACCSVSSLRWSAGALLLAFTLWTRSWKKMAKVPWHMNPTCLLICGCFVKNMQKCFFFPPKQKSQTSQMYHTSPVAAPVYPDGIPVASFGPAPPRSVVPAICPVGIGSTLLLAFTAPFLFSSVPILRCILCLVWWAPRWLVPWSWILLAWVQSPCTWSPLHSDLHLCLSLI